ncbi:MAG: 30S ribosomal protein S20 [Hyphomonadaceae bacterium]
MANTASAKKATRKIVFRTTINKSRFSRVKTHWRKLEDALEAGDVVVARAAFIAAESEQMRAVAKGIVHRNAGARKVSRMAQRVNALCLDVVSISESKAAQRPRDITPDDRAMPITKDRLEFLESPEKIKALIAQGNEHLSEEEIEIVFEELLEAAAEQLELERKEALAE